MTAIEKCFAAIMGCDYVLIGAGAGLSAAAGLSFADEAAFRADYPALWDQGVHSDYQTFSYKGWREGQRWAYLAKHIQKMLVEMPPLPLYGELLDLLEGTNYHIITSNVDRQFYKAGFPMDRVFEAQGHYDALRCSAHCSDEVWPLAPFLPEMLAHIDEENLTVAEIYTPHCPRCGAPLALAFRDNGEHADQEARYRAFLHQSEDASIAIIEFGVGFNSAGVIRVPFERIVGERAQAQFFRVTVDYPDSEEEIAYPEIPRPIADKSVSINADARAVIRALLAMKQAAGQ
ncbi:MAG: hypothetical protein Q4C56_03965 [Peptococcaceae bacterium]|nr:hypothetical protein [Peptococcaceae bacterium]